VCQHRAVDLARRNREDAGLDLLDDRARTRRLERIGAATASRRRGGGDRRRRSTPGGRRGRAVVHDHFARRSELPALEDRLQGLGFDTRIVPFDSYPERAQLENQILFGDLHHSREVCDPDLRHSGDALLDSAWLFVALRSSVAIGRLGSF
jgi:hypothetical protein